MRFVVLPVFMAAVVPPLLSCTGAVQANGSPSGSRTIRGRALDDVGNPIPFARVSFAAERKSVRAFADREGQFAVHGASKAAGVLYLSNSIYESLDPKTGSSVPASAPIDISKHAHAGPWEYAEYAVPVPASDKGVTEMDVKLKLGGRVLLKNATTSDRLVGWAATPRAEALDESGLRWSFWGSRETDVSEPDVSWVGILADKGTTAFRGSAHFGEAGNSPEVVIEWDIVEVPISAGTTTEYRVEIPAPDFSRTSIEVSVLMEDLSYATTNAERLKEAGYHVGEISDLPERFYSPLGEPVHMTVRRIADDWTIRLAPDEGGHVRIPGLDSGAYELVAEYWVLHQYMQLAPTEVPRGAGVIRGEPFHLEVTAEPRKISIVFPGQMPDAAKQGKGIKGEVLYKLD